MRSAGSVRRHTVPVAVGNTVIGGDAPVRVQSMTTTPTLDIDASVAQAARLAGAGAELIRLTAQGIQHAAALEEIHSRLRSQGIDTPLVADIHFNPAAAFEAAKHVEKVRINPGNFADPGRTFRKMVFTDSEYAAELQRLRQRLLPFLELCRANGTAIRIGVNHGSLSDRVMSRFGDGTDGMVESAMEFLRICREADFHNIVLSIKASDVPTMTTTVRQLVRAMDAENMHYPLHLGVTEAGNALEGRVKSAMGIGSLLADGIGDTIRVSLSEDPVEEIPVARTLLAHIARNAADTPAIPPVTHRRAAAPPAIEKPSDNRRWIVADKGNRIARSIETVAADPEAAIVVAYPAGMDAGEVAVAAAVDLGYILLAAPPAAIWVDAPALSHDQTVRLCQTIVQSAGLQRFRAEIVACPGCGRTLFDLPAALEQVKKAAGHLSHLKIAVMGCIVNGPGEMAGADYGYVGAAAGCVSIYRGIEPVAKNIPQSQAIGKLIETIKADGQWTDAPQ